MLLLANLFAFFSLPYSRENVSMQVIDKRSTPGSTSLLHFFVLRGCLEYGRHIVGETKLLEGLGDVVARYGFLGLLL